MMEQRSMRGAILRGIEQQTEWYRSCSMTAESMFEEMKRYVRFEERDARLLARLHPLASPHFPRIAEEFYERIREHEDAHRVFTGEAQIQRLQRSLVRWMNRVFTGPHDEHYFRHTAEIGRVHVRIGLPQRYMFTAMALIRVALLRIADEASSEDADGTREAICRALDLELAIMLESYRDDLIARIQQTERSETERAYRTLQRAERRYKSAVELARVLIVGLDARGDIHLFNREAERVTGFARDEVMGKPFVATLCAEPDQEEHTRAITEAASGKRLERDVIECVIRTRAGHLRDVMWQIASSEPSEGAGDDVVLFAIGRDVTDEHAMAARLRQNEKLAAVGTLAAGLAHEIRNPLNGALLHVTFLERGLKRASADPDALDAVRIVGDELKRLSTLVSEFLDFARPKPLERGSVGLRALCERAVQLIAPAAAAAGAQIATALPRAELSLELDPGKMEQVLLNLLQNAIEALEPKGGGHITLRAYRRPRQVVIEVEDDGTGLPSPDAPIFDAFYSTKASGTGLGLAIVHRIVTDHDGLIDVESQPGKTIFRVILPLRLPPAEQAEQRDIEE